MKKYIKPEMDIKYFADHILTTDLEPISPLSEVVYAAGSVNSVTMGAGAQRTTTADIRDILKFK